MQGVLVGECSVASAIIPGLIMKHAVDASTSLEGLQSNNNHQRSYGRYIRQIISLIESCSTSIT